ncbi:hypothetical protein JCM14469_10610 [Desulfatiferula olefinivorans]
MPWEGPRIQHTDTISPRPILIGLAALTLGALVYLTDRSPSSAWLIDRLTGRFSLSFCGSDVFGVLGDNLPAFAHVFAFSLITAALMTTRRSAYGACMFWVLVNILFELGQARPDILGLVLPEGRLLNYFAKGTFDILDILACIAGGPAAAVVLTMIEKRSDRR